MLSLFSSGSIFKFIASIPEAQKPPVLSCSLPLSPAPWAPLEGAAAMAGRLQNQQGHWQGWGLNNPMGGAQGCEHSHQTPKICTQFAECYGSLWFNISKVTQEKKFQKCVLTQVIWRLISLSSKNIYSNICYMFCLLYVYIYIYVVFILYLF